MDSSRGKRARSNERRPPGSRDASPPPPATCPREDREDDNTRAPMDEVKRVAKVIISECFDDQSSNSNKERLNTAVRKAEATYNRSKEAGDPGFEEFTGQERANGFPNLDHPWIVANVSRPKSITKIDYILERLVPRDKSMEALSMQDLNPADMKDQLRIMMARSLRHALTEFSMGFTLIWPGKEPAISRVDAALRTALLKPLGVGKETKYLPFNVFGAAEYTMGGVYVHARVRPTSQQSAWATTDTCLSNVGWQHSPPFVFHKVHSAAATNESIFDSVEPLVGAAFGDGYNVAVMTYGQTGSGKTHTMIGNHDDRGIIPRVAQSLVSLKNAAPQDGTTIEISCIELYNEKVQDLLDRRMEVQVQLRRDGTLAFGPVRNEIRDYEDYQEVSRRYEKVRAMGVKDDHHSNRSHMMLCFTITRPNRVPSCIYLVDLAGSEGATQRQGQSLLTLGNVVNEIAEGRHQPPYGESKLTLLLRDCLQGGFTFMIATVNPDPGNHEQTVRALKFAQRAMKMKAAQYCCPLSPEIHTLIPEILKSRYKLKAAWESPRLSGGLTISEMEAFKKILEQATTGHFLRVNKFHQLVLSSGLFKDAQLSEKIDIVALALGCSMCVALLHHAVSAPNAKVDQMCSAFRTLLATEELPTTVLGVHNRLRRRYWAAIAHALRRQVQKSTPTLSGSPTPALEESPPNDVPPRISLAPVRFCESHEFQPIEWSPDADGTTDIQQQEVKCARCHEQLAEGRLFSCQHCPEKVCDTCYDRISSPDHTPQLLLGAQQRPARTATPSPLSTPTTTDIRSSQALSLSEQQQQLGASTSRATSQPNEEATSAIEVPRDFSYVSDEERAMLFKQPWIIAFGWHKGSLIYKCGQPGATGVYGGGRKSAVLATLPKKRLLVAEEDQELVTIVEEDFTEEDQELVKLCSESSKQMEWGSREFKFTACDRRGTEAELAETIGEPIVYLQEMRLRKHCGEPPKFTFEFDLSNGGHQRFSDEGGFWQEFRWRQDDREFLVGKGNVAVAKLRLIETTACQLAPTRPRFSAHIYSRMMKDVSASEFEDEEEQDTNSDSDYSL